MKRTRHAPEQIIRKLREAERLLASGKEMEEVCPPLLARPLVELPTEGLTFPRKGA
jgi:hypothetical protein